MQRLRAAPRALRQRGLRQAATGPAQGAEPRPWQASVEEFLAHLEAKESGQHAGLDLEEWVPLRPEALELLRRLRRERRPRGPVGLSLLALWELWERHGLPRSLRARPTAAEAKRPEARGAAGPEGVPAGAPVARLHEPTPEEFFGCVLRNQPVVISGAVDERGFPPLRDFDDTGYLRSRCGHRLVRLKADVFLDHEGREVFTDDPGREMRFAEFLDRLEAAEGSGTSPRCYLGKSRLEEVAPELADDVLRAPASPLRLFGRCFGENQQGVHTYLGGGRNTTPIHCDPGENLLVVIAGTKRFDLYPPTDADCLYTLQGTNSSVPPFLPPRAMPPEVASRCPLYRHAQPVSVELEKGDILYLPIFWWHCVDGSVERNMILNWWCEPHPEKAEPTGESEGARAVMGHIRQMLAA